MVHRTERRYRLPGGIEIESLKINIKILVFLTAIHAKIIGAPSPQINPNVISLTIAVFHCPASHCLTRVAHSLVYSVAHSAVRYTSVRYTPVRYTLADFCGLVNQHPPSNGVRPCPAPSLIHVDAASSPEYGYAPSGAAHTAVPFGLIDKTSLWRA